MRRLWPADFPTPMNPMYREREIRFQLENSGAAFFITDAPIIHGVNLGGLPALRTVFTTRASAAGAEDFADLRSRQLRCFPRLRRLPM